MQDEYVAKILEWPTPTSVNQLNSLLGFMNYYQSFIKDFSVLTTEMNSQRKEKVLTWTEVMEKKFQELKYKFKKNTIGAYPRYGDSEEPFEILPDYSREAVGHVLQQRQGGELRLIAAGGRKITPAKKDNNPSIVYTDHEHLETADNFIVRHVPDRKTGTTDGPF